METIVGYEIRIRPRDWDGSVTYPGMDFDYYYIRDKWEAISVAFRLWYQRYPDLLGYLMWSDETGYITTNIHASGAKILLGFYAMHENDLPSGTEFTTLKELAQTKEFFKGRP